MKFVRLNSKTGENKVKLVLKRDISSHLRAEHAMLNQCHSAICNFFNVTALSVTSLETPMNRLPKVDQMEMDSVMN